MAGDAAVRARPATSSAAFERIDADIAATGPMQRLLMGEVGSGKTVVALHAMLRAVEAGRQAALMAPTETLAEQHMATLDRLLGGLVPIALLTGSTPAARRRELLGRLAQRRAVADRRHPRADRAGRRVPRRWPLAVVDEQHRFGVRQRAALDAKAPDGLAPHVLHMTATPIPRTLALTAYGDLDVTALRELPAGRKPVETHVVDGARGAGPGLRAGPRGDRGGAPGVRRLPAGRGVRGAAGEGRDRGGRAARGAPSSATTASS